ncbi:MAG TPA: hypothetical protein VFQ67_05250 [Allosphingosinicella sp.]|jgi:hypothetical protein|nr:hypothetical protein [Allosphingosinicella sp.]
MDQQQPERNVEAAAADSRAKWTRPEVDRFVAGGAESGGTTSTDGVDILS